MQQNLMVFKLKIIQLYENFIIKGKYRKNYKKS